MPCACGRSFVPELDYYHAHVQTPEHQRWRIEVIERGVERYSLGRALAKELVGIDLSMADGEQELERMRGTAA